jgi:hypothetical protein
VRLRLNRALARGYRATIRPITRRSVATPSFLTM